MDIDDAKLSMARALGADYTVNSTGREPFEEIYHLTENRGTDIVVESAGTPITSAQAFSFARKGGKVIFLGIPYGDVLVKRLYFEKIVRNELQIFGSWNAISSPFPGKEWEASLHFMKSGQIRGKEMVTHRGSLQDGPALFAMAAARKANYGKILFYPEQM